MNTILNAIGGFFVRIGQRILNHGVRKEQAAAPTEAKQEQAVARPSVVVVFGDNRPQPIPVNKEVASDYRPSILGPRPSAAPNAGPVTISPQPQPANPHPQIPQGGYEYRPSWMGPRRV